MLGQEEQQQNDQMGRGSQPSQNAPSSSMFSQEQSTSFRNPRGYNNGRLDDRRMDQDKFPARGFEFKGRVSGLNEGLGLSDYEKTYVNGVDEAINERGASLSERFNTLANIGLDILKNVGSATLSLTKALARDTLKAMTKLSYLVVKVSAVYDAVGYLASNVVRLSLLALSFQGFKKSKVVDPKKMDREAKSLAQRSYINFENSSLIKAITYGASRFVAVFATNATILSASNYVSKMLLGPLGSVAAATATILPNRTNNLLQQIGYKLGFINRTDVVFVEREEPITEKTMVELGGAVVGAAASTMLSPIVAPIVVAAGTNAALFAYEKYSAANDQRNDRGNFSRGFDQRQQSSTVLEEEEGSDCESNYGSDSEENKTTRRRSNRLGSE